MRITTTCMVVMATLALATGCSEEAHELDRPAPGEPAAPAPPPVATVAGPAGTAATTPPPLPLTRPDFGEALRSASLKLVGELPSLADIKAIATATEVDKKNVYAALIDKYMADPRFAVAQIAWWRNTLKTGRDEGAPAPAAMAPSMETAATFAAQVVVEGRAYTELLTASSGTCPTFDGASGTFTKTSCTNGAPTAGILTDPGLMAQYTSNMAFRRVRFVQETFACAKFPAEVLAKGTPMGGGIYGSPWAFDSITGGPGSRIDFKDTSAVVCANCHTTMNHMAPLFANFDANGKLTSSIQVDTPVTPIVKTTREDWLPPGQPLAWRNGVGVTDLPSLGAAMAKDPEVGRCAVVRTWNWAFSRGDVVNDGATIPPGVIEALEKAFTADGMKLKPLIRSVFTADEFTRF